MADRTHRLQPDPLDHGRSRPGPNPRAVLVLQPRPPTAPTLAGAKSSSPPKPPFLAPTLEPSRPGQTASTPKTSPARASGCSLLQHKLPKTRRAQGRCSYQTARRQCKFLVALELPLCVVDESLKLPVMPRVHGSSRRPGGPRSRECVG